MEQVVKDIESMENVDLTKESYTNEQEVWFVN